MGRNFPHRQYSGVKMIDVFYTCILNNATTFTVFLFLLYLPFTAALAASRMGISVSEVEDVLSLDDEVLQDTYLYHLPPNPKSIRLPPSILSLLLSHLNEYIVTKKAGPVTIINWYHRQFDEVGCIPLFLKVVLINIKHILFA